MITVIIMIMIITIITVITTIIVIIIIILQCQLQGIMPDIVQLQTTPETVPASKSL